MQISNEMNIEQLLLKFTSLKYNDDKTKVKLVTTNNSLIIFKQINLFFIISNEDNMRMEWT
jgi:hypothetical protein